MSVYTLQGIARYMQLLQPTLSAGAQQAIKGIATGMLTNPSRGVQMLWRIALNEINNPAVLRQLLTMARPCLGAFGLAAAEIQVACVALTGMTVGALVIEVMFFISVAVLVLMLILLALWLLKKVIEFIPVAVQWTPSWNRKPTPAPKQPDWSPLLNVLHGQSLGPVWTISNRQVASEVRGLKPA